MSSSSSDFRSDGDRLRELSKRNRRSVLINSFTEEFTKVYKDVLGMLELTACYGDESATLDVEFSVEKNEDTLNLKVREFCKWVEKEAGIKYTFETRSGGHTLSNIPRFEAKAFHSSSLVIRILFAW
jgi:CRISPR/Cas system-associated protein Cas10 (large subunit of type III CRISPR-Cas system)